MAGTSADITVFSSSAVERLPAGLGLRIKALLLTALLIVVTLGLGWLVWSVLEWRRGSTASYRRLGLRVVRRSDGSPIGFCRSMVRNAVCCTLLLVPTLIVCCLLAIVFVMGASPPDQLLSRPRAAPWDVLTKTAVIAERPLSSPDPARVAQSTGNGKGSISGL